MQDEHKRAFFAEMSAMAELYGRTLSRDSLQMIWDDLAEFTYAEVRSAIAAHRQDPDRGQYFPKPADLIHKLRGSNTERAAQAWTDVLRLAADSYSARSSDPIAQQVVSDMGGWQRLGRTPESELRWLAKDFAERYSALANRQAVHGTLAAPTVLRLVKQEGDNNA
jgi:hypothetical protein